MNPGVFLRIAAVLLPLVPAAHGQTSDDEIDSVVDSQRSGAPRLTFGLREAPDRYDFENAHYLQGIVMIACIGIFIGTVCLLCGLCQCVMRCSKSKTKTPQIYTSNERLWPKIAIFPVTIAVLLGAGLAYQGNAEFEPELTAFSNGLVLNSQTRAADTAGIISSLNALDLSPTGRKLVLMRLVTLQADEDVVFVKESENDLKTLNDNRATALQATAALSLIVCTMVILLVLVKKRALGNATAALGFLSLFIVWTSFGLHYAGTVVVADICHELKDFSVNATDTGAVGSGSGSSIGPARVYPVVPTTGASGVEASDTADTDTTLVTPFTRCLSVSTVNNVVALAARGGDESVANLTAAANVDPASIPSLDQENRESVRSQVQQIAGINAANAEVVALAGVTERWLDSMRDLGRLAECEFVRATFQASRASFCISWITTLRRITAGNGIIAVVLIFATVIALLGADRFPTPTVRRRKNAAKRKKQARAKANTREARNKGPRSAATLGAGAAAGAAVGATAAAAHDDGRFHQDYSVANPDVDALPALMTGHALDADLDYDAYQEEEEGGDQNY